jgi:hypothetical protein
MIRRAVRRAANAVGIDVHRFSKAGGCGNYHVDDYYPVDLIPRWGHGKPPHPQITAILNQQREEFLAVLRQLSPLRPSGFNTPRKYSQFAHSILEE